MVDGMTDIASGDKSECKVLPYKDLKCPSGQQRHHIVPDYALRSASRKAGTRVPGMDNMPLSNGPCICLKGHARSSFSDHGKAHQGQDPKIFAAGQGGKFGPSFPDGTAPLSEVLKISKEEVGAVKEHCKEEINKAVDDAFGGDPPKFNPNTPCRTTQEIPTGDALTKLSKTVESTLNLR